MKAREEERARAIREGKMDDPTKPKRLEDAITIVGTCPDMCPEFERYRRERENNLDRWECVSVLLAIAFNMTMPCHLYRSSDLTENRQKE